MTPKHPSPAPRAGIPSREFIGGLKQDDDKHRREAALLAGELTGEPVHLPVPLDCTQSGLQNYALLMRDAALGAKVNVFRKEGTPEDTALLLSTPLEAWPPEWAPGSALSGTQDFYGLVAKDVNVKGIDRRVVKALGNPQIYGAGLLLQTQKLAEIQGVDLADRAQAKRARKDARKVRLAILEHAPAFRTLSAWLRGCAALAAAHSLPLVWTHADGFVVLQDSRRLKKGRDHFYLPGHKRSIDYGTKDPTEAIDTHAQERRIAANYIHSCDGLYLREVLRQARAKGLPLAVAHDSFACHPNDLPRLKRLMVGALDSVFGQSPLVALWHELDRQGIFALPGAHTPWMDRGFVWGDLICDLAKVGTCGRVKEHAGLHI